MNKATELFPKHGLSPISGYTIIIGIFVRAVMYESQSI